MEEEARGGIVANWNFSFGSRGGMVFSGSGSGGISFSSGSCGGISFSVLKSGGISFLGSGSGGIQCPSVAFLCLGLLGPSALRERFAW